jgi:hypothetical protein
MARSFALALDFPAFPHKDTIMKLHHIAFAAGVFAVASAASAATVTINAAGASASRVVVTNAVVESLCGAAASTTVYRNGTNVTRIVCPSTLSAGNTLDFSYDNTTGSYLGVGPVSGVAGALTARINLTTCSGTGTESIAGKTVAVRSCTGNEATKVRPAIGNADVEPSLFADLNVPAGLAAPIPEGFSDTKGQYGVIFGSIVSEKLYRALQADQGFTAAAAAAVLDTSEANAPSLSRAQIVSLATANGGPLNTNWARLFKGAVPAEALSQPVKVARRVAGSGSQASFNAVMLNYLCSPTGATPAGAADSSATYVVNEQGSTGNLIAQVNSTTAYAFGEAVSRENAMPASGWGFVKIDGVYPSKANTIAGRYNWMAEQVLTLKDSPNADEQAHFDKLVQVMGAPTTIDGFTAAAKDGIVALPGVADPVDGKYATHATKFRTLGNSCVVPTAAE